MKRNLSKRLVAILLLAVMLMSALPLSVLASSNQSSDSPVVFSDGASTSTDSDVVQGLPGILDEDELVEFPLTFRDVSNSQELETALTDGIDAIRIVSDFEIDRTFFITSDTIVYCESAVTLTRSASFAGDVFVVGQGADGALVKNGVFFSLGGATGNGEGTLTINGNSENLTVDVCGTVIFVSPNSQADLYENLVITNNKKVANERALNSVHGLSNTTYIGGAVAILAKDSTMNIFGGTYSNNSANTTTTSGYGGAFYSFATLNMYAGVIENNSAVRAGAVYSYRTFNLFGGELKNNTASSYGGAIYLPSSSGAKLYLGQENEYVIGSVTFEGNYGKSGAGAIYNAGKIIASNTLFKENSSDGSSGAILSSGQYSNVIIDSSSFVSNVAATEGGAINAFSHNKDNDVYITNTSFIGNEADLGGAIYLNSEVCAYVQNTSFTDNTTSSGGSAIRSDGGVIEIDNATLKGNSGSSGTISLVNQSVAVFNKLTAESNAATGNGGALFASESDVTVYNSSFKSNTGKSGAAVYLSTSAVGKIYGSSFIGNYCTESNTGNAAAVMIYTSGTEVTLHSCTFAQNTSNGLGGALLISGKSLANLYNITAIENHAAKGGALYITSAGTVVNASGLTVSGNTASVGGPIIWGNTANAKLFINKTNYVDLDVSTALDSAYWSAAISNALKVSDYAEGIPSYTDYSGEIIDGLWTAVLVSSVDELEKALADKAPLIKITTDITVDRTLYVLSNAQIFTTSSAKIIRANGFTGELFAVDGSQASLKLGNATSNTRDLLVIDGNGVNGADSVISVGSGASAELYENVTVKNNSCTSSVITVNEGASLTLNCVISENSSQEQIILNNGSLSIVGGSYELNSGSLVYNNGSLSIDGGEFTQNTAANGAIVYNNGTLLVKAGVFTGNSAENGGAIYVAGGTVEISGASFNECTATNGGAVAIYGGYVTIGAEFDGCTATNGGALYIENALDITVTKAYFNSCSATNGGAIYSVATAITVSNSTFTGNYAENGGAVAIYNTTEVTFSANSASGNEAKTNGAFAYVCASSVESYNNSISDGVSFNGGAYMLTYSALKSSNDTFTSNSATNGGVIYAEASNIVLEATVLSANHADYNGGAIYLTDSSAEIKGIEAKNGSADNQGGAIYAVASELSVINSSFEFNKSEMNGGAIALSDDAVMDAYGLTLKQNSSERDGGAIYLDTNGSLATLQLCSFESNKASGFGGAICVSGKSVLELYDTTALNNSALRGGFMHVTDSGTEVTINGITVSGNTATNGNIVYGNATGATVYVNKESWTDTSTTKLDSTYFASAFYGQLTVKAIYEQAPEIKPDDSGDISSAVDVSSSQELYDALVSGEKYIKIIADFEIDRTFYITYGVTIFTSEPHTLTRDSGFGGDIFVIGEHEDGTNSMLAKADASLTLGNPSSSAPSMLVIDGNKDNMSVDVCGTVFFVVYGAKAHLYDNVTVQNCHKNNNERTQLSKYALSRPTRIGGSVGIIAMGSINIYGGNYLNNSVRDQSDSSEEGRLSTIGGIFYNESNLNIHGGLFEGNQAARGGVVYSYAIVKIYGGSFIANVGTTAGGVYYAPSYASCHLNIGFEAESEILFKDNVSVGSGGVISCGTMSGIVIHGNTTFEGNKSLEGSGGVISTSSMIIVRDTTFINNTAKTYGGAIYHSKSSEEKGTRIVTIERCDFVGNSAETGGAVVAYSDIDLELETGCIMNISDSTFTANTASYGGAAYFNGKSTVKVLSSVFEENSTKNEAGAIYITSKANVTVQDCELKSNTSGNHGGAFSVRSSFLTLNNSRLDSNTASNNGGAMYIAYTSAIDCNASVSINDTVIKSCSASGSGGAIYATRRAIEGDTKVLSIKSTDFSMNYASGSGGAVLLTAGVDVSMSDVTFISNSTALKSDHNGGAIDVLGSSLEINNGIFTRNNSYTGGAIYLGNKASVVLNDVTASRNRASSNGGFIYSSFADLKVYNSDIKSNSGGMGGAMYLYEGASAEIYKTTFTSNEARSDTNGGALFVYTFGKEVIVQDCAFNNNHAGSSGGAIYVSGEAILNLYNNTATGNIADVKGGFMYVTKAGTVVNLAGLTVSGNTAPDGAFIWGNTANADMYIDKQSVTDLDASGELTDEYWKSVIKGNLTVLDYEGEIPTYSDYNEVIEGVVSTTQKKPVSVDVIFDLAVNSSDGYINSTYDKFPVLDNSSNFMSKEQTVFENINGQDVTVDTYVYQNYHTDGNMNVGQGLMIYQAMLYKQANPDEEVYIDIASYRFSVQAAVNINRDSRYFGYMRQLTSDYDSYGFVRISYLLVCAAKMGIHVNVMGHIDAYPLTSNDRLETYFTKHFDDPCDSNYVKDGVVGDYMTFTKFDWQLSGSSKGGTDMMHVKLCAVSHYLDMNGEVHKNAVWTSSSNLDGIQTKGYNANWKLQTATIISDHEQIYNVAVNYLRLMTNYSEQEHVIEFQNLVNVWSTEQIDLILAGRGDEIPKNEQIVYIGTENDDVFEFYFTPMAGDILSWDETYNPYAKYLRELYDSEDYIIFTWNAAEYSGGFPLGRQIEQMIIDAFHNNKNPHNKIYANMESFDKTTFDDLIVGVDIGYKSINEKLYGSVHNKDLQFSYVKNGQRYYVSLLNSCNLHSGSMYYQPNFALVIKETTCASDSVFNTIVEYSTSGGLVEHSLGKEYIKEAENGQHSYKYAYCTVCEEMEIIEEIHTPTDWIVDKEATSNANGIQHKECTVCKKVLETQEIIYAGNRFELNLDSLTGMTFDATSAIPIDLSSAPLTLEATINVPKSMSSRAGVIVSNYGIDDKNAISLEIYTNGQVRLFVVNKGLRSDCLFSTDIRSDDKTHIAVTVTGKTASLYVNGKLAESKSLASSLPDISNNFVIGGDNRSGNAQYFKGTIYSVSLFKDVRTADEIAKDSLLVVPTASNLLYSRYFTNEGAQGGTILDTEKLDGKAFESAYEIGAIGSISTIEALIKASDSDLGMILSNYVSDSADSVRLEITSSGALKLTVVNGNTTEEIIFASDVRKDKAVHIAITVANGVATLYVNGVATEEKTISCDIPSSENPYFIGANGDGSNVFSGTVYSVNLFNDVRTAEEIKQDTVLVAAETQGLASSTYFDENGNATTVYGQKFDSSSMGSTGCTSGQPLTFEAVINVPKNISESAGMIISNYGTTDEPFYLEIFGAGRIKLYYVSDGTAVTCLFKTNIRSDGPVHIALTITNRTARLYVNGVQKETLGLTKALPSSIENLTIGGDTRTGNTKYFKGTIYSVALFDHVRTADQIKQDAMFVDASTEGIIFLGQYTKAQADKVNDSALHKNTNYVIDIPAGAEDGVAHYECAVCGKILKYVSVFAEAPIIDRLNPTGGLASDEKHKISEKFASTPLTFEAIFQLSTDFKDRAGVLIGNYDASANNQVNVEVYTNGNLRLYYKVNGTAYTYQFKTDVRSDELTHLALTIDGLSAKLYINGALVETVELTVEIPETSSLKYCIGADNRAANPQLFKGTIYSVSLFEDVRTAEEIAIDAICVPSDTQGLIYQESFFQN